MDEEEGYEVGWMNSQPGDAKSRGKLAKTKKSKNKKQEEEVVECNGKSSDMGAESGRKRKKKVTLEETAEDETGSLSSYVKEGKKYKKKRKDGLIAMPGKVNDEEELKDEVYPSSDLNSAAVGVEEERLVNDGETDTARNRKKKKKRLLMEAAKVDKRGVCYLSRVPPQMDPVRLRQLLSHYGDIQRIYLAPEDPTIQVHRKKAGGFRGQGFSEGWVEFTDKSVAKRVANMLNGEQIGGRKRSQFYYDLWNIKYLSKFKWDDLTEEIAYKNAIREQKLALEISAAKRERDFYLSKVDQSRALSSIEERMKKKQKVQQESGTDLSSSHQPAKVIRQFTQTKPVADKVEQRKPQLSKDILSGVFGGS
ncbi:hypothetical protein K2173_014240 [Erythroxylum novogranatense]|uniref:RRM domain-containing protein n=1 Tax=Erythroxylum novogranatense TaxID=1862640 RepID=A0AAV8SDS5_9ROSI|nr:hypothetical protein K2173_014240 [Erythroxylum novogranatense]